MSNCTYEGPFVHPPDVTKVNMSNGGKLMTEESRNTRRIDLPQCNFADHKLNCGITQASAEDCSPEFWHSRH